MTEQTPVSLTTAGEVRAREFLYLADVQLLQAAADEWVALGLMSYYDRRPDLSSDDIEQLRTLIHDLAKALARAIDQPLPSGTVDL